MNDQRSKAAAAFGKDFMREARSNPALPKNSVVAAQKTANARPIPTFAVGGKVTKAVEAYRKADQAADAKLVKKAVESVGGKRSGGKVARCAAGGVGKYRKGQAEMPGRG